MLFEWIWTSILRHFQLNLPHECEWVSAPLEWESTMLNVTHACYLKIERNRIRWAHNRYTLLSFSFTTRFHPLFCVQHIRLLNEFLLIDIWKGNYLISMVLLFTQLWMSETSFLRTQWTFAHFLRLFVDVCFWHTSRGYWNTSLFNLKYISVSYC